MRKQEEGEPVDAFVTDLYALAEHCSFGALHDEMIRERLVVGLLSARLSEKFQLDAELTLEKAITQVRQAEAIKFQQSVIRGEGAGKPDIPVGSVNKRRPYQRPRYAPGPRQNKSPTQSNPAPSSTCTRCGLTPRHDRAQCPARDAECRKCRKRGHYQKMCRSNTQADVAGVQESTEAEVPFLGAIGSERRNPWEVTVSLNKKPVKFQIDSGAEVTVVPDSMLRKLTGVNLKPTQRTLKGPTQGILPVRGQFRGTLVFGDREVQQDIYVVTKLLKPLLGQPAIEALKLLVRVGTVADGTETQNPVQRFPQLFHGLG